MIEYFTIPELPDKPMFRCERRNATLQVASCASMWKAANSKCNAESNISCRTCPLGAVHAGEGDAVMSHLRGVEICSRCHRVGMRLIGGDICVSCWNRAREVIVGKNARGRKPLNHPPIVPHAITVLTGKSLVTIKRAYAISTDELIIAALRDSTRQVYFSFHINGMQNNVPLQGELF
jgi:hypothetical protein